MKVPVMAHRESVKMDEKKRREIVKYVVDQSGQGTHTTIASALQDAQDSPNHHTLVTIRPVITLDDFMKEP